MKTQSHLLLLEERLRDSRLIIRQPLAVGTANCEKRPLTVAYFTSVPAKIELVSVALQVLLADVVKRAVDAPFD